MHIGWIQTIKPKGGTYDEGMQDVQKTYLGSSSPHRVTQCPLLTLWRADSQIDMRDRGLNEGLHGAQDMYQTGKLSRPARWGWGPIMSRTEMTTSRFDGVRALSVDRARTLKMAHVVKMKHDSACGLQTVCRHEDSPRA